MNENDFKEIVRNMRRRTTRLEREGDYWNDEEKERLVRLFDDSVGITEIAVLLQRTERAVSQQIEKLGLYNDEEYPLRRRRLEKAPECLCGRCRVDPTSCPYCSNCLSRKPDHREGL